MQKSDIIDRLKASIGKPAATLIAAPDASERRFIGEALLVAATVFLLQKYFDGFA